MARIALMFPVQPLVQSCQLGARFEGIALVASIRALFPAAVPHLAGGAITAFLPRPADTGAPQAGHESNHVG